MKRSYSCRPRERDSRSPAGIPAGNDTGHRRRKAFTLIEMLLVVAIIGIVTVVTLPSFVGSIRGNRMRMASRSVVMAGRYARSMAVMKQVEMALTFDLDGSSLSVRPALVRSLTGGGDSEIMAARAEQEKTNAVMDLDSSGSFIERNAEGVTGTSTARVGTVNTDEELVRKLEGVLISEIEVESTQEKFTSGKCTVVYRSNGTCSPYKVKIADKGGTFVLVNVDSLSSATTENSK